MQSSVPATRLAGRKRWWSRSSRRRESSIVARRAERFCWKFYYLRMTSVPELDTDIELNWPLSLFFSLYPPFSLPPSLPSFSPLWHLDVRGRRQQRERKRGGGETVTPALTVTCTADVTADGIQEREMRKALVPHCLACQSGKVGQPCRFCQVEKWKKKKKKQTNLHVYFQKPTHRLKTTEQNVVNWCAHIVKRLSFEFGEFSLAEVLFGSSLLAWLVSVELPGCNNRAQLI